MLSKELSIRPLGTTCVAHLGRNLSREWGGVFLVNSERPSTHRVSVVYWPTSKMAELSAEAPLAPSEEWSEFISEAVPSAYDQVTNGNGPLLRNKALDNVKKIDTLNGGGGCNMADHFGETGSELASLSTSLEDLVNTFDDQITKCFRDMDQNVESLAPVQIRNQDDIISESQYVLKLAH